MSTKKCYFLHRSAVLASCWPQCIVPWPLLSRLDISHFFGMKRAATSPPAPSSTGKDTSLLCKALRDLSGASNLKDERVGHHSHGSTGQGAEKGKKGKKRKREKEGGTFRVLGELL